MRRRDIDPALWQDEKFGNLSIGAQLLFLWTWNDADDWGVLRWRPERCKSGAFLYKHRINIGHVRDYMHEIEEARMICPWDASGERWSVVRMFLRWQSVNKPAQSKCAAPPSDVVALLPDPIEWRSYKIISTLVAGGAPEVPGWVASRVRDRSRGRSPGADPDPVSESNKNHPHPTDAPAPSQRKARAPQHNKPFLDMDDSWEWKNITETYRKAWHEDFPGIDLDAELRKARAWVRASPAKRHKKDWVRFLAGSWFKNAQERASGVQRLPVVEERIARLQAEREWQKVIKACATENQDTIQAAHDCLCDRTLDALRQFNKNTFYAMMEIPVVRDPRLTETRHRQFVAAWVASEVPTDQEDVA